MAGEIGGLPLSGPGDASLVAARDHDTVPARRDAAGGAMGTRDGRTARPPARRRSRPCAGPTIGAGPAGHRAAPRAARPARARAGSRRPSSSPSCSGRALVAGARSRWPRTSSAGTWAWRPSPGPPTASSRRSRASASRRRLVWRPRSSWDAGRWQSGRPDDGRSGRRATSQTACSSRWAASSARSSGC